jgi:hypothetical protein
MITFHPTERILEAPMDDANRTPTKATADQQKKSHRYKIVAAIEQVETDRVINELGNSGFARELIDVVTAEDVQGLDQPIGGMSVRGFLTRLGLSLGADLEEFELARSELAAGHVIVMVEARGDAEQKLAHDVLRQHGGHNMTYFGRWTITTLESDAH